MRRYKRDIHEYYDQNDELCYVTTIKKFIFESESEREYYSDRMKRLGYEDSGQIKANLAHFLNPIMYGSEVTY